MKDPYYIEIKNFNWQMTLDELKNLQVEKGSAVDSVEVSIDFESLDEYEPKHGDNDVLVHVSGLNRHGEMRVKKEYGIKLLADQKKEPERANSYTGFYPKGEIVEIGMPVRWNNDPKGLIVHYTAGWSNTEQKSINTLRGGKKNGYTYWTMSESGTVYMDTKATEHGYHCGTYHHRDHLGIEINNGGKLDSNKKTWFKYAPPEDRIRYADYEGQEKGFYMTYTKEQEQSLIDLCYWLKDTYPSFSFDNVLGHDEVARGRKNDPGGSLSMSMKDFRQFLKDNYKS